VHRSG